MTLHLLGWWKKLKNTFPGNVGIAYTYNEPTIWYEFVYETSKLAKRKRSCKCIGDKWISVKSPLADTLPFIDAMNIDLKAFKASFYKDICKSENALEHVKTQLHML